MSASQIHGPTITLMRPKPHTSGATTAFGLRPAAVAVLVCVQLLWPVRGPGTPPPPGTARTTAAGVADQDGPPFERTVTRLRYGFANTPASHGSADLHGAFRPALTTPPPEPVPAYVGSFPEPAELQYQRGRAPPCSRFNRLTFV